MYTSCYNACTRQDGGHLERQAPKKTQRQSGKEGNNEKKNINAWLEQWNEQSRNGEHWMTREMDSDELYSVLMETFIQQRLIKSARHILLEKIDELMDR